ncbi:MAG TPA: hypothetical protein VLY23_06870 [Candidatus Acidoferrum sp.]|nr:hypothetical protein [Candidatus Acidoferrum sp.]
MASLLGDPERYNGKFVRTVGFLCVEFEGNAVYLHEEDYAHGLTGNAFRLGLSQSQAKQFKGLTLKYALIEGTVSAHPPDQTHTWAGDIESVRHVEAWPAYRKPVPRE